MATIEQRESGYYQAKVRKKGYPPQSKTFRTKKEAQEWAKQVEASMHQGSFVNLALAERTTFKDVADQFSKDFAPHHYRDKEWPRKLAQLVKKLGKYNMIAFTPQLIAKYRDDRLKDADPRYTRVPEKAPRVSPSTVKKEIELLSKVLDVASKEFGIPLPGGNPVHSIRKPKQGAPRDRRLDAAEWDALMIQVKASLNPWLHAAVLLSVETAMRQGELLALEWNRVYKQNKMAMLPITKNGTPRAVPLSTTAIAVLDSLPTDIKGRVIPLEKQTLYMAFKSACRRAGIKNYTWHDLRHEALSRIAERGNMIELEMAAVSGHKTLQMLKRYTHLQAEKLAEKLG